MHPSVEIKFHIFTLFFSLPYCEIVARRGPPFTVFPLPPTVFIFCIVKESDISWNFCPFFFHEP